MKLYILNLTLLISASALQAQDNFTIKGKIKGIKEDKKIMVVYQDGSRRVTDSTIATKGKFKITGQISDPSKASIEMTSVEPDPGPMTVEKYLSRDIQDFYIDGGKISVKGNNIKNATIKGGRTQSDYARLKTQLKPLEDKMAPISLKMRELQKDTEKNKTQIEETFSQLRTIRMDMTKAEQDFIAANPNSFVTLYMLEERSAVIDEKTFAPAYNALSEEVKNSTLGKQLGQKLAVSMKTGIGKTAINFTQNDIKGKPVSLSSLKGKYVLIDFWASWCGPCRQENPNLVKAYNKFKNKNFEILAVSLDDKKDRWLEAIQQDGLPWIHVSDLKGWKNEVAVEYGINAVPQSLLLDPNGVIIAKNLRGEELEKKLAEVLK